MTNNRHQLRSRRVEAGLPAILLARAAGVSSGRLSEIERAYVNPSPSELERLENALEQLLVARRKLIKMAEEVGWPGRI